jgi:hypothetical protein
MKKTRIIAIAVLIVGGGLALHVARAQQPGIKRTDRATVPSGAASPPAHPVNRQASGGSYEIQRSTSGD